MIVQRRAVGCLVLLLAVVALIVAPRALRDPSLGGQAMRGQFPEPPPIGACLAGLPSDQVPSVVDCDEPHLYEVTARWLAEDPNRRIARDPATCQRLGTIYTGLVDRAYGDWTLTISIDTMRLRAPQTERAGRTGWTVCVVGATLDQPITTTLLGAGLNPGSMPDALGMCWIGTYEGSITPSSCQKPHSWQVLATAVVASVYTEVDTSSTTRQVETVPVMPASPTCLEVAATLLATDDPTFGGELTFTQEEGFAAADDVASGLTTVACVAGVTGDRALVRNLIGLADGPIPWTS